MKTKKKGLRSGDLLFTLISQDASKETKYDALVELRERLDYYKRRVKELSGVASSKTGIKMKYARCMKCGTMDDLTKDHIIPSSKGGNGTANNLQLLCGKCNVKKSDNLPSNLKRDITTKKTFAFMWQKYGNMFRSKKYLKELMDNSLW